MSEENVELLHRAIAAFNRRDLDGYLALQDSGVEFTPYERAVEGLGPYRGHAGIRTWWEESFAALPDLSSELFESETWATSPSRGVASVDRERQAAHPSSARSG
jgi:hypothetical protein